MITHALERPDELAEAYAGKLAAVAYQVVLNHPQRESWLQLQLDLWRALADSVRDLRDSLQAEEAAAETA